MPAPGAAYANSVTRTLLSTASTATSSEPCRIPFSFWDPAKAGGQAFRVTARGYFSTTGTPTLTLAAALDTTQGTFGTALAATGAFTTPSGASGAEFHLCFECSTLGLGTSGSLSVGGTAAVGAAANAATTAAAVYMVGTSAGVAVNTTVDNYLEIWGTWGAASASNTLTLTQFFLEALN
jgi:hypothetical protein